MSQPVDTTALAMMVGERVLMRTQTHPLSTVAGTAVVGWILARGLPGVAVRLGISAAVRFAGAYVVEELSGRVAESSASVEDVTPKPRSEI